MTYEEFAESQRAWLISTARYLNRFSGRVSWEDLAQEGSIALWKAFNKFESGNLIGFARLCARRAMIDCMQKNRLYKRTDGRAIHEDAFALDDPEMDVWAQLACVDDIESIETAYHHGKIHEAISKLSPAQQKYVRLRFFEGMEHAEMEREFGYNMGSLWSSKKNGAKTKLMTELEELRTLV